jgi:hypothetical protein
MRKDRSDLMPQDKSQVLTSAASEAARFANELVPEPVAVLDLRIEANSEKGKQAQPAYALQRNQALTRGKGGYSGWSIPDVEDPSLGMAESSAQLLERRSQ